MFKPTAVHPYASTNAVARRWLNMALGRRNDPRTRDMSENGATGAEFQKSLPAANHKGARYVF